MMADDQGAARLCRQSDHFWCDIECQQNRFDKAIGISDLQTNPIPGFSHFLRGNCLHNRDDGGNSYAAVWLF
ncbi:MAG: hypothetical protein SCM11_15430 [Bacillota bacterium]|nr:hypothetical protein [Bacillota bacterium]